MKYLIITLFLFFSVLFSFGQRKVEGSVLDSRSNQPVPEARVSAGTETVPVKADGTFVLGNLPEKGKITLTVSAPGYRTRVFNVTDLTGGQYRLDENSFVSNSFVSMELTGTRIWDIAARP